MGERGVGRGQPVQAWPFEKCKPSTSLTISRNPGRDRKGKFQYWLIHSTTFIRCPQGAPELSGTIPFQVENMCCTGHKAGVDRGSLLVQRERWHSPWGPEDAVPVPWSAWGTVSLSYTAPIMTTALPPTDRWGNWGPGRLWLSCGMRQ